MMNEHGRFAGTWRHIRIHWRAYLFGYGGGMLLTLAIIGVSAQQGWLAFIPPAIAILLILGYFLGASLWASYMQFDVREQRDAYVMFSLGRIQPTERFAYIGLGDLETPVALSRRLTSGHLTVVDIYNPQQMPGALLARMRRLERRPPKDPRISWLDGNIDLLPIPDESIRVVTMGRSLGTLWQRGDQLCLLQEIRRILAIGGRLILAERIRSETNALVLGPFIMRLPSDGYWRDLLEEAGFRLAGERSVHGLVHYWQAEKPFPAAQTRLEFDFG